MKNLVNIIIAFFVSIWKIFRRNFSTNFKEGIPSSYLPAKSMKLTSTGLRQMNPEHTIQGAWTNPIYSPRNRTFKGYMRENRRCSFNKNK